MVLNFQLLKSLPAAHPITKALQNDCVYRKPETFISI